MREVPKSSKIAVAMSGGIDSGVAAALLVEQGYEVVGLFMRHLEGVGDQEKAARRVADCLDISLEVIDLREEFREKVIEYFLDEYRAGRTPNPCVVCNKFIKFGKLLEHARGLGCCYLATGHYARIICGYPNESPKLCKLLRGVDEFKDQSYFLWQLSQKQLEHILFPVGDLTKDGVRKIAYEKKLPVAERSESFEICFIPGSLEAFLRRQIPEAIKPGPVIDTSGNVIGRHRGLPLYTYGQRRGFELEKYQGIPLYVVGIDRERNALIVGRGKDSEVSEFGVGEINWMDSLDGMMERPVLSERTGLSSVRCCVRIRHQGELMPAAVELLGDNKARVVLDEPTRAVTPGQSAVFYRGEELLGGGVISGFGT